MENGPNCTLFERFFKIYVFTFDTCSVHVFQFILYFVATSKLCILISDAVLDDDLIQVLRNSNWFMLIPEMSK
jgi:hypothetical protein